jgi:hypothetical protein
MNFDLTIWILRKEAQIAQNNTDRELEKWIMKIV